MCSSRTEIEGGLTFVCPMLIDAHAAQHDARYFSTSLSALIGFF